ncbi:hypothetical protein Fmac_003025 [Flemingia macrophylla]|uniref:Uncharacterized protein n=1 Tax=Flemingia macrophylla TaxID=520843 RepID=A0ABD1NPI1_9FABA
MITFASIVGNPNTDKDIIISSRELQLPIIQTQIDIQIGVTVKRHPSSVPCRLFGHSLNPQPALPFVSEKP